MKLTPYWWDQMQMTPGNEAMKAAHLPATDVDLLVVGGGFTGLSAALTAARLGKSVLVCDAGQMGLGASTRNGGICSGNIRYDHGTLETRYGREFADGVYAEGIEARLDLARFCAEEKIDCHLQMTGRFTGAMTPKDYDSLARNIEALNRIDGHEGWAVPRAEQHQEINTGRFFGGVVRAEIGGYHPGLFYEGLLRVVEQAGVLLSAYTPVMSIETDSQAGKKIQTEKGVVRAAQVIVATNGYTGTTRPFGRFLRRRLVPVQSCIMVTEDLGEDRIKQLMPALRMYGNTAALYCYFRPTPDRRRVLLGARSFDRLTPSARSVAYLGRKLAELFPELADVKTEYCWLGNVAFYSSQLPRIFTHDDIWYAAGYAGSGTVWARWLGKKTAEMAFGLSNQPSQFYGLPPKAIPFYDGYPWFINAVNTSYALKDRLKALLYARN